MNISKITIGQPEGEPWPEAVRQLSANDAVFAELILELSREVEELKRKVQQLEQRLQFR